MEAKEFLSRAWYAENRIQAKMEQIKWLRSMACRVTAGFDEFGGSRSQNVTAMQDTIVQITEAEAELDRMIAELMAARREVIHIISRVEDKTERLLLEKRYLSWMTIRKIAEELHYGERWVKKKHHDALDAVQRILDERETGGNPARASV